VVVSIIEIPKEEGLMVEEREGIEES